MRTQWILGALVLYSAVLTLGLLVVAHEVFGRHAAAARTFDRLRVHRIDIVEPDGTPRLILSDRTFFPGSFYHGAETPRADRRDAAGLLMLNDEGTEDGGLIWGGLSRDGKPMNFSHLSFDQYEQDQTLSLDASADDGERFAGVRLNDMPRAPLTPQLIREFERLNALPDGTAKEQAMTAFKSRFPGGHRRAALERSADDSVALTLSDDQGRPRLRAMVGRDGQPLIEFLDEAGRVTKTVSATRPP